MNEEKMLIDFINSYMNFKMTDNDFEDGVNSLSRPNVIQTRSFYVEAFKAATENEAAHNVLNIIICSDKNIEQNILDAKINKPQLKKCLETLHFFSKENKSEDQEYSLTSS